jgi:hypothetical protein
MQKAGNNNILHKKKKTNQGQSNNSKFKGQRAGTKSRGQGK